MNLKGIYTVSDYIDQGPYYPDMSWSEVDHAYNGVGPEKWPEHIREKLDEHLSMFRDAVVIHDCDYDRGLTEEDKRDADERFLRNCRRCVNHHVAWYRHPLFWLEKRAVAYALYLAVRDFGDSAFWAGKNRPKN